MTDKQLDLVIRFTPAPQNKSDEMCEGLMGAMYPGWTKTAGWRPHRCWPGQSMPGARALGNYKKNTNPKQEARDYVGRRRLLAEEIELAGPSYSHKLIGGGSGFFLSPSGADNKHR